ncbi:MAG: NOB1 family endonuclease [Promethearchaeota archaeon]
MKKDKFILIFDTNIFLLGIDFNLIKGTIYTTPGVIEEIKVAKYAEKNRTIMQRIDVARERKKLIVRSPSKNILNQVEETSKMTGDRHSISMTDKEVISLALELMEAKKERVIVYTNDYSMENICAELGLEFSPVGKKGITEKIIWEIYCPFCRKKSPSTQLDTVCERCGQKMIRRKQK